MILGMSLETFTFVHVVISLVGIMTGFIVVALMLSSAPIAGWNGFFLIATILTSVTGFFFPLKAFGPPHIVGVISLVVLAVALFAVYGRKLSGTWRSVYVGSAILALYLNVFVGVVQSFAVQDNTFVYAYTKNPILRQSIARHLRGLLTSHPSRGL